MLIEPLLDCILENLALKMSLIFKTIESGRADFLGFPCPEGELSM